jgi:hypothetical protein
MRDDSWPTGRAARARRETSDSERTARLSGRQVDEALALAREGPPSTDVGTRAQLIGQSLDRRGEPAGAFEAFEQMNREDARTGAEVASQARKSRGELAEQRSLLTPEWLER